MKTIIAGSRRVPVRGNAELIARAVEKSEFVVTEVVSGGAEGVDRLGELWAKEHGIMVRRFLPDYDALPPSNRWRAPLLRNCRMAEYADALIAIWDGRSRGTIDMIRNARKRGLKIHIERMAWAT